MKYAIEQLEIQQDILVENAEILIKENQQNAGISALLKASELNRAIGVLMAYDKFNNQ